ncbi:MAG: M20/M25/M40 family metallo-hydrolase [Ignavibacteriales bacterium]
MRHFNAKAISCLTLWVLLITSIFAQIPGGYEKGFSTINKKRMYADIAFFASDSMKGRPTGSRENLSAARYIAEKFRLLGLKPLLTSDRKTTAKKGTEIEEGAETPEIESPSESDLYLQKFNLKKTRLTENSSLSIIENIPGGKVQRSYKSKIDFLLHYHLPEGIDITSPVVFLGYGIDYGENGYSDYMDEAGNKIDVRNKIVLIVDGFPQDRNPESVFSKSKNVLYRNPLRKAELAASKGALAVLIMNSVTKTEPPVPVKYAKSIPNFQRINFSLPGITREDIPIFYVSNTIVKALFKGTGKKVEDLVEMNNTDLKSRSFEFKEKAIGMDIDVEQELLNTQNVVAFLEGTDPKLKDEIVVIGAHYDHIGLGYYGASDIQDIGKIHPGADDNASGTAGLIALAEAFSKTPPKRSIVFMAFTGEENGIQGSRYYVNNQPLKPIDKTIAMLNLDMISRNNEDELMIGGAFYSAEIIKVLERANQNIKLNLFYNTGIYSTASDQAHFIRKKIPSLFFFGGFHEDYHRITDVIEKININKAETVTKLAYLTGWILGNENTKPSFKEANHEERMEIVRESMERRKILEQNK